MFDYSYWVVRARGRLSLVTWTWWASDKPTYGRLHLLPGSGFGQGKFYAMMRFKLSVFPFCYNFTASNVKYLPSLRPDQPDYNGSELIFVSLSKYRIDSRADMFDGSMLTSINKTAPWSTECQQKWHPATYSLASLSDIMLKVLELICVVKWRQPLIRLVTENIFSLLPPGNCAN